MLMLRELPILFRRDERGNFAVIGALMLVPILATMGAAVDYSKAYGTRSKIQASADTAALAAAMDATTVNQFQDLTEAYMAANLPELDLEIAPRTGPDSVEVVVTHRYQTAFLAMVGISEIPIEVETEVAIRKFNRAVINPSGDANRTGNNTGRINGRSLNQREIQVLEALRDRLIQSVGNLPPRDQERARKRIREKFDSYIRQARSGADGSPVYIKR